MKMIFGLLLLIILTGGCSTLTPAQRQTWIAKVEQDRQYEAAYERVLGDPSWGR